MIKPIWFSCFDLKKPNGEKLAFGINIVHSIVQAIRKASQLAGLFATGVVAVVITSYLLWVLRQLAPETGKLGLEDVQGRLYLVGGSC